MSDELSINSILTDLRAHAEHNGDTALQERVRQLENALSGVGPSISVGDISGSTAVAIGKDIQIVVNQNTNLPADLLARLTAFADTLKQRAVTAPRFLVPFPHNPDFVGRDEELSNLHEMLQQQQSIVGIRPTVLVGLGGIGKTQLAVEYAHAHRDDYPSGVFWLNAINPLLIEFSDLAEKLELSDRDTPRDKAARKAWDYLDSHPNALVIFDNVLEPSELNQPFSPDLVPANLRCRTLFTTRQRDFPRNFQPFEVKVLPEMAAMRLLLRARPEVLEEHHPEWGWARIVCAYLGWLPLALELAAAYLGAYPDVSITGYLERLRTEGSLETVDASEVRAVDLPTRVEEILKAAAAGNLEFKHQVAVSATLQTQWKRLDDEDARLLFRAAGQFPEASWIPIPRLGLLTGIESKAKAGRPSPLNVVLKKLYAVSLIEELSEDRLRLHPLVQEFAISISPTDFKMMLAKRIYKEMFDLSRLQTRVEKYGVDSVLGDIRTGLFFCKDKPKAKIHVYLSDLERVLDRQAHHLRAWDAKAYPAFLLQQLLHQSFQFGFSKFQSRLEAELTKTGYLYVLERFRTNDKPHQFMRSLTSRGGRISSIAMSDNGSVAVSTEGGHITVWDVETGRELRAFGGGYNVSLSANGQIAITSEGGILYVWDVGTGRELRNIKPSEDVNSIRSLTLSADGQYAACVYSLNDKEVYLDSNEYYSPEYGKIVSTDGDRIDHEPQDDEIVIWEVVTGHRLCTFESFTHHIEKVVLSSDAKLAVSLSEGMLTVWDAITGYELYRLGNIGSTDVDLSADGRTSVSLNTNATITLWDVANGQELYSFYVGQNIHLGGIVLSADGRVIIFHSTEDSIKVWDAKMKRELLTIREKMGNIALSANGRLAISIVGDTIQVWTTSESNQFLSDGEKLDGNIHPAPFDIGGMIFSANGQFVIALERGKSHQERFGFKVWDLETGSSISNFDLQCSGKSQMKWSADGKIVIHTQYSQRRISLVVWDLIKGVELRAINLAEIPPDVLTEPPEWYSLIVNFISSAESAVEIVLNFVFGVLAFIMAFLSGFQRGFLGEIGGFIAERFDSLDLHEFSAFLNNISGPLFKIPDLEPNKPDVLALSSDGRLAATILRNKLIKVWDVMSGSELCAFIGYNHTVKSAAMSTDGKLTIYYGHESTFKVWDIPSGIELYTSQNDDFDSVNVTIHCDGRLAISTRGRELTVWDVFAGQQLRNLHFNLKIIDAIFTADGRKVITELEDHSLVVRDLATGTDLLVISNYLSSISDLALSADGNLAFLTRDGHLYAVNSKGQVIAKFSFDTAFISCALSPDGRYLVAADKNNKIHFLKWVQGAINTGDAQESF